MSLATLAGDAPHAANLFYARDGWALIWVSDFTTRHSRHIEDCASVAVTIAPDYSDFPDIQGLQISGHARRIDLEPERARARDRLETRYPFLRRLSQPDLRAAYDRAAFYRLEPRRIVLIDNKRGFGSKEVLEFDPAHSPRGDGISADRVP